MEDRTFSVAVAWSFRLRTTEDAFQADNPVLLDELRRDARPDQAVRALVVLDAGVVRADPLLVRRVHHWFQANEGAGIRLAAAPQVLDGGEPGKMGLGIVERLGRLCAEVGLCRHSYLVMVGGGALLDAAGFAGSLVHRGIRQIRLPTTTLAQCDAGLGVKNAVNAFGQKNFLGTFTVPRAIINDRSFLDRQDDRSWRAGVAEAVKVGIIKDAAFVHRLHALAPAIARRDRSALAEAIDRCAALHLDHITTAGDPFELGSSRPLDFGHWSAHRLEVLSEHRLQHGEAVAIGVALDLAYAVLIDRLSASDAELCWQTLAALGFRLWDECLDLKDAHGERLVLGGLTQFREHLGGDLTLAMPDGLGNRRDIDHLDHGIFERACGLVRRFQAAHRQPLATGA